MLTFLIHEPDYLGDEPKAVVARTIYDAAEEYARYRDRDGFLRESDEPIQVDIEAPNGETTRFRLLAEVSVEYTCRAIEPKPSNP